MKPQIMRHFMEDRATLQQAKDTLEPRILKDIKAFVEDVQKSMFKHFGVVNIDSPHAKDILLMLITERSVPSWLYIQRLNTAIEASEKSLK